MNPPTVTIETPIEDYEFEFEGEEMDIVVAYTGTAGDNPILFYVIMITHETNKHLSYCTVKDSDGGNATWTLTDEGNFSGGDHIVRVIAVDDECFGGISEDRTITIRTA